MRKILYARMFNALERLHVRVEPRAQFLSPAQTSGHLRHVLVQRHLAGALAHLHGVVVDVLAGEDVLVHHAHHFRVVLVELDLDERSLEEGPEDVNQLPRKHPNITS